MLLPILELPCLTFFKELVRELLGISLEEFRQIQKYRQITQFLCDLHIRVRRY